LLHELPTAFASIDPPIRPDEAAPVGSNHEAHVTNSVRLDEPLSLFSCEAEAELIAHLALNGVLLHSLHHPFSPVPC
jgi:hypothetical protein